MPEASVVSEFLVSSAGNVVGASVARSSSGNGSPEASVVATAGNVVEASVVGPSWGGASPEASVVGSTVVVVV